MPSMYYIGSLSGTSMDAIDLALVRMDPPAHSGASQDSSSFTLKTYRQYPFPASLRDAMQAIDAHSRLAEVMRVDTLLGHTLADAVQSVLQETDVPSADIQAIGSHGQTVLHLPDSPWYSSWQIGNPNILSWETGIPVVADFRRMDMAAGGHGAPLATAFHAWRFAAKGQTRIVANIGGITNISVLPADPNAPVLGFDTGPGNVLLDTWHGLHQGGCMDEDATWARQGRANPDLIEVLLRDPWFQRPAPKSTGREYFNLAWLETYLQGQRYDPKDVQASLLELTARSMCTEVLRYSSGETELFLCGGGVRNPLLMERIAALLPQVSLQDTSVLGLHPDAVEAMAFAWLAYCRMMHRPVALEDVTGASARTVLGAVYRPPAAGPTATPP